MNGWSTKRSQNPRPAAFVRRPAGNLPSQMDGRINYSDWIKKVGAANTRQPVSQPHTAIIIIIILGV